MADSIQQEQQQPVASKTLDERSRSAKQPDDATSSVCGSQTRSQKAAFIRNRESLQDLIYRKLSTKHQAKVVNPEHVCPFQDFLRAMVNKFTSTALPLTEKSLRGFDKEISAEVAERLESGDWTVAEEAPVAETDEENPYEAPAPQSATIKPSHSCAVSSQKGGVFVNRSGSVQHLSAQQSGCGASVRSHSSLSEFLANNDAWEAIQKHHVYHAYQQKSQQKLKLRQAQQSLREELDQQREAFQSRKVSHKQEMRAYSQQLISESQHHLQEEARRRNLKKQEEVRQFQERLQLWQDKSKSLKSARQLKLAEDKKLLSFQADKERQDIEKVFRQKQLKIQQIRQARTDAQNQIESRKLDKAR